MCENGNGVVKGFAQYICPPESNVYHIPDHLSLREAALAEPLSCCLHGMDLLDVKLGDVVVVIGMGMIGSMMVKLCSIAGASHIIVIETQENKKRKCQRLRRNFIYQSKCGKCGNGNCTKWNSKC